MATYADKLKDPRWQKKRLQILSRDNWKCYYCGDSKTELHVHHVKYETKNPWEANEKNLVSVCKHCHFEIEGLKEDISFGCNNELEWSVFKSALEDGSRILIFKNPVTNIASLSVYDQNNVCIIGGYLYPDLQKDLANLLMKGHEQKNG